MSAFVEELRSRSVTPHIAIDGHLSKTGKPRKTATDLRTTRHAGYAVSQRCRKRLEEVFGWIKASADLAKVKLRGRARRRRLQAGTGGLQSDPPTEAAGGNSMRHLGPRPKRRPAEPTFRAYRPMPTLNPTKNKNFFDSLLALRRKADYRLPLDKTENHRKTTVAGPLRVLHAYKIYRPDIEGGIPAIMSTLAQDHATNGHRIICARERGCGRRVLVDGVPVHAVTSLGTKLSTPMAPGYIPAFISRARKADIVIHHAPFPLTDAAVVLGLPADVGLIVYWHAEIVRYGAMLKLLSPLIRRALARADRILVSNEAIVERSAFLQPHVAKCVAVPYGIDLAYWRTTQEDDRAEIEALRRQHPRLIVSLGRLVAYKGFDVLVKAMKDVDGHALIIGEGPLRAELSRSVAELGITDRVSFTGRLERKRIRQIMHAARIFAFPSVSEAEAFGIVQVEAMATGLPVVNTSLPTTVPIVARHEREALTVPPCNPTAFAKALNRLLDDPSLAEELGQAGKVRAFAEYEQTVFQQRLAAIYAEVVAIHGRGRSA